MGSKQLTSTMPRATALKQLTTAYTADIERGIIYITERNTATGFDYYAVVNAIHQCMGCGRTTIYFIIDTYGGSLSEAWALYDWIVNLGVSTIAVLVGSVMSGGTLIAAACDKRYMARHTVLMFHEPSLVTDGKLNEITTELQTVKQEKLEMAKVYAGVTNKKVTWWLDALDSDTYYKYRAAKKLGFVQGQLSKRLIQRMIA